MQAERMYALDFEIAEDGTVNLEQDSGCGEVDRISLHPAQLRLLAERAGLAQPPEAFVRRILKRLEEPMRIAGYVEDILEAGSFYLSEQIQAANAADGRMLASLLGALVEELESYIPGCGNGTSVTQALPSVTSPTVTPSSPTATTEQLVTGKPRTNAERQAAYRERQKRLALEEKGPSGSPSGA